MVVCAVYRSRRDKGRAAESASTGVNIRVCGLNTFSKLPF